MLACSPAQAKLTAVGWLLQRLQFMHSGNMQSRPPACRSPPEPCLQESVSQAAVCTRRHIGSGRGGRAGGRGANMTSGRGRGKSEERDASVEVSDADEQLRIAAHAAAPNDPADPGSAAGADGSPEMGSDSAQVLEPKPSPRYVRVTFTDTDPASHAQRCLEHIPTMAQAFRAAASRMARRQIGAWFP